MMMQLSGSAFELLSFGFSVLAHAISASPRSTFPVSTTVRMIDAYAAHRQMCPASPAFT